MLKHKGFTASFHYSSEDACFVGRINDIKSSVSFEGNTEKELQKAFEEAVEDYLDFCKRKKIEVPVGL